jgi:ankyrin repeat protein
MSASHKGYIDIVKILLTAGANVNAVDDDNMTALKYAKESYHKDIAALLIKYGAKK